MTTQSSERRNTFVDLPPCLLLISVALVILAPNVFAGRVFYLGDAGRFEIPALVSYARSLRSGSLPFWEDNVLCGFPSLSLSSQPALYPFHLLLLPWLDPIVVLNTCYLFHLALMLLSGYAAFRLVGLTPWAACVGALMIGAGGHVTVRLVHYMVFVSATWLAVLFAASAGLSRGHRWAGPVLALASGMSWLGGHPQFNVIMFVVFIAWTWSAAQSGTRIRLFVRAGGWYGLGLLLASVQLVPAMESLPVCNRRMTVDPLEFLRGFPLNWSDLPRMVMPDLLGSPGTSDFRGPVIYWECTAFLSVTGAALGLAGLLLPNVRRHFPSSFIACLGLIVIGLLMASAFLPVYLVLVRIPFLNSMRGAGRWTLLIVYAMSWLAALCAQELSPRQNRNASGAHIAATVALTMLSVLVLSYIGLNGLRLPNLSLVAGRPAPNPYAAAAAALGGPLGLWAIIPLALSTFLLGLRKFLRVRQAALAFFIAAEFVHYSHLINPTLPADCFRPEWPARIGIRLPRERVAFRRGRLPPEEGWLLHPIADFDRELWQYVLGAPDHNLGVCYGMKYANGTEAVKPWYLDLFWAGFERPPGTPYAVYAGPRGYIARLAPSPRQADGMLKAAGVDHPRAWLVGRLVLAGQHPAAQLDLLTDRAFCPDTVATVDLIPPGWQDTTLQNDSLGAVGPIQGEGTRLNLTVDVKVQQAFLVLADTYMPQWQAFVDGRPTPIYRTNLAFRGVVVPRGKHNVTLVYRLKSWPWALSLSMLAGVSLLLLSVRAFLVRGQGR